MIYNDVEMERNFVNVLGYIFLRFLSPRLTMPPLTSRPLAATLLTSTNAALERSSISQKWLLSARLSNRDVQKKKQYLSFYAILLELNSRICN